MDFVHDAPRYPIWVNPAHPARQGRRDVKLSIDSISSECREDLLKGIEGPTRAAELQVIDPVSGEILAMVDIIRDPTKPTLPWAMPVLQSQVQARDPPPAAPAPPARPAARSSAKAAPVHARRAPPLDCEHPDPLAQDHPALGRNRCIEDVYEPGSTFKPYVWSTVTELGLASPAKSRHPQRLMDHPDGRPIKGRPHRPEHDLVQRPRELIQHRHDPAEPIVSASSSSTTPSSASASAARWASAPPARARHRYPHEALVQGHTNLRSPSR